MRSKIDFKSLCLAAAPGVVLLGISGCNTPDTTDANSRSTAPASTRATSTPSGSSTTPTPSP